MTEEIQHFNSNNYPSERLIVFSSVILQRDKISTKGPAIRRLIDRRLSLWQQEKYNILLQEASRCDKALRRRQSHNRSNTSEHRSKVFTCLMLQGKVRSAMRWFTERSSGGLMSSSEVKGSNGSNESVSVFEILKNKHPAPQLPFNTSLLKVESLPYFGGY